MTTGHPENSDSNMPKDELPKQEILGLCRKLDEAAIDLGEMLSRLDILSERQWRPAVAG